MLDNTFAKFKIDLKLIELSTIYCVDRSNIYQYIDFGLSQNKIGEGVTRAYDLVPTTIKAKIPLIVLYCAEAHINRYGRSMKSGSVHNEE